MPKDGNKTRLKILDETTQLVLENGFAGTSIDRILERTELTKGAFFYHFSSKAELALNLMEHFVKNDMAELQATLDQTAMYEDQPRKRLLAIVQRFIDIYDELDTPYPGCLYASYVYEPDQFGPEIRQKVAEAILNWRKALADIIEDAKQSSPTPVHVDSESLADMLTVMMEGSIITSKALEDAGMMARQLRLYRHYIELLFPDRD